MNKELNIDLKAIDESPELLDLLIQVEDLLDSLDVFIFKHWVDGEIVAGPVVRRYWIDVILRYEQMPDPRGAHRLMKYGIRINFDEATEEGEETGDTSKKIWLVHISVPRRLISDTNAGQLDYYDEEGDVESEDVIDAQDAGLTSDQGYEDSDNQNNQEADDDQNT